MTYNILDLTDPERVKYVERRFMEIAQFTTKQEAQAFFTQRGYTAKTHQIAEYGYFERA